ncbi:hypothetical protein FRB91_001718 [Serendipita sp. 411]|nr:hypothetical protein FRC19_004183 [Serendipita sp. 401]KAG8843997.1 hypothetical protein FRC20_003663 [Serendipita sp. 405]KAG8855773.1 hypothetical protein FRB91_001718 [Serendipita sp. 411]KAG9057440.1 hypothetical protein FS842_006688 [Serendipita sp. 407]
MSAHLVMSSNSLRHTTFSCDSLGIHYEVNGTTKHGLTTVERWDSSTNHNVFVGDFRLPWFKKDTMRMGVDGQWIYRDQFLYKVGNNPFSFTRHFMGSNGVKYKWRIHWDQLQLYHASPEAAKQPLAVFHRHRSPSNQSYLEILDFSVLSSLDSIIVTFLIMERHRRNRKKATRSHGGGGGP